MGHEHTSRRCSGRRRCKLLLRLRGLELQEVQVLRMSLLLLLLLLLLRRRRRWRLPGPLLGVAAATA